MDFAKQANLGYAFVNMISRDWADRFWTQLTGFSGWVLKSDKVGQVSWSEPLQGLRMQIGRYRNCPVMHKDVPDDYKPILLYHGERIPFPEPTKKIQKRRARAP